MHEVPLGTLGVGAVLLVSDDALVTFCQAGNEIRRIIE